MSLGDAVLSGLSTEPFEAAVPKLIHYSRRHVVSQIQVWDLDGKFDRTVLREGVGLEDVESVLEFDSSRMTKFACVIDVSVAGIATRCVLGLERWNHETVISGTVYLEQLVGAMASSEEALRALAEEALRMARALDARFLGLASEDDKEASLAVGVFLQAPFLFLVIGANNAVQGRHTAVEPRDDLALVWLQDPARSVDELTWDSPAIRECRAHLREYLGQRMARARDERV